MVKTSFENKPVNSSSSDIIDATVLVTNDDGIAASGINILYELACSLFSDVWVVAPMAEQSGKGHSLTLRDTLRVEKKSEKIFSVKGTPTDCVVVALNHIMKDTPPNLVLSGINNGYNLCEEITYSGTIGAAIEATIAKIPAIALSQESTEGGNTDWGASRKHAAAIIKKLFMSNFPESTLMNVNFPSCLDPGHRIKITRQGKMKISDELIIDHRSGQELVFRIGKMNKSEDLLPDTDLAAIGSGHISITPLSIDLTNHPAMTTLNKLFNS